MYGWRGRIGVIIPSSNTTMECELWKMAPDGVSVHAARMKLVEVTPEALREMASEALEAAVKLATAGVDVIIYGCTTGSLLEGPEWENRLTEQLERETGIKVVTTARAVVDALRALKARRIVVATPYIDELNARERKFLEEHGFEVLRIEGLGIKPNLEIGRQPPEIAYMLARRIFAPEADAVFISCTNFRSLEVIEVLEENLGRPVISSNTASMWAALRAIGVREPIKGAGTLLEEHL